MIDECERQLRELLVVWDYALTNEQHADVVLWLACVRSQQWLPRQPPWYWVQWWGTCSRWSRVLASIVAGFLFCNTQTLMSFDQSATPIAGPLSLARSQLQIIFLAVVVSELWCPVWSLLYVIGSNLRRPLDEARYTEMLGDVHIECNDKRITDKAGQNAMAVPATRDANVWDAKALTDHGCVQVEKLIFILKRLDSQYYLPFSLQVTLRQMQDALNARLTIRGEFIAQTDYLKLQETIPMKANRNSDADTGAKTDCTSPKTGATENGEKVMSSF